MHSGGAGEMTEASWTAESADILHGPVVPSSGPRCAGLILTDRVTVFALCFAVSSPSGKHTAPWGFFFSFLNPQDTKFACVVFLLTCPQAPLSSGRFLLSKHKMNRAMFLGSCLLVKESSLPGASNSQGEME